MSSTRNDAGKQQAHLNFIRDILYPGGATLIAHPFRVALNLSPSDTSWKTTLTKTWPRLYNGMALNITRGTCAASSQFYAKRIAQEYAGFTAGVFAASLSGTLVATLVETWLIRKNTKPAHLSFKPPLWRFSLPLSALYLSREIGFTMGVLTKNDMAPITQNIMLLNSAFVTASLHKLAVSEATRDYLPKGVTVPNFRDGIGFTVRAIARGDTYTHPSFQVKYPRPDTLAKQIVNFLGAACGWNVFRFRLAYLFVFREAYNHMPLISDSIQHHARLFTRRDAVPVQDEEEQLNQRKTTR